MSFPLIMIGAGGHAKVLLEALRLTGRQIKGILTLEKALWGKEVWGIPVLGNDDRIDLFNPHETELINGIGSTGNSSTRIRIFEAMSEKSFSFAKVVHPSAIISRDTFLGEGAQVMAGAIIQPGCEIGNNVIINTGAIVDHDCRIGNHVHLAPGVSISGGVTVGAGTHVGTGASVIQGIIIGEAVFVAAGSVVTHDIAKGAQVRGIPARIAEEGAKW